MYESGLVVLDLTDIVDGGPDMPNSAALHTRRSKHLPLLQLGLACTGHVRFCHADRETLTAATA